MLRQLRRPLAGALAQDSGAAWLTCARGCTVSVAVGPEHHDVPAGHHKSDLSDTACNIGLNRRRDLTLRQDIRLHTPGGEHTLASLFKDKLAIVFGVPDMGKVCSERHAPSYQQLAKDIRGAGVDRVFCVAVGSPGKTEAWAAGLKLADSGIETLADKNGAFTRSLGVDANRPEAPTGPYCHRFAALIEDGILLKLRVEERPADVKVSSAQSMLDCLKALQSLN